MIISLEEKMQRIERLERILYAKLKLDNLTLEELEALFLKLIPYLQHGRNNQDLVGRTAETFEKNLEDFISFANLINMTDSEIITCISNFPSIIRMINEEFYLKYILMSVVENENNTLRKEKLITRPMDFKIDLHLLYARLCLMKQLDYPDITWNSLVKNSENDFAKIFTKGKYQKPYKIYDSLEDISSEKLKNMFQVDYNYITFLANLPINEVLINKKELNDGKGTK